MRRIYTNGSAADATANASRYDKNLQWKLPSSHTQQYVSFLSWILNIVCTEIKSKLFRVWFPSFHTSMKSRDFAMCHHQISLPSLPKCSDHYQVNKNDFSELSHWKKQMTILEYIYVRLPKTDLYTYQTGYHNL